MLSKFYKKSKNNNNKNLFYLLFNSKIFYTYKFNKARIKLYVYGLRYNFIILNIKYNYSFLKRSFLFIKNLLLLNKKILVIANSKNSNFLFPKKKISKNIFVYQSNWFYGYLTNKKILKYPFTKKFDLLLILNFSGNYDEFIIKEAFKLKIPIFALIDITNLKILKYITYPIIINKNIKSIFLFRYLLKKIFNYV